MLCYVLAIVATVFISNNAVNSAETCKSVKAGAHYSSLIPFSGLKSDAIVSSRVKFTQSAGRYLFAPTESRGHLCTTSWNKLWGACRCGYLTSNHKDSDRFVFRRANSCVQHENGYTVGEVEDCSEKDLVEIAAYAYDDSRKPFEHQGTLLKEFATKLRVDTWYKVTLIFEEAKTTYQLFDDEGQHLETQEIIHRQCKDFKLGTWQDLYFGGQCPAPQAVSVCYEKI
ncbi:unnamed protein product [Adineta steineri]|uniref:Uncharacterized protein n=1 Tax=Adineta steineri TaxID=433720 RepID=A0A813QP30_9BILA|nr:unnamed protein product [Adineta steineri]CAF0770692.1 unnamed protein product [Adineta steineri]